MIDTFMVLWNRHHRKTGAKVLLTFLFICISISLLLVTVGLTARSLFPVAHKARKLAVTVNLTATAQANNAIAMVNVTPGNVTPVSTTQSCVSTSMTVVEETPVPRSSAVLGGNRPQPTKGANHPRPSPTKAATMSVTPTEDVTPTNTLTPDPTMGDGTPVETATDVPFPGPTFIVPPPIHVHKTPIRKHRTPTPYATQTPGGTPASTVTASATNGSGEAEGTVAAPHFKNGNMGNTSESPANTPDTHANQNDPLRGGGAQCLSNSLSNATDTDSIKVIEFNLGIILGGGLLGTLLFYGVLYTMYRQKRKRA